MFCPNCGKEIADGAKFCGSCGTKIEPAPKQEQPKAEPLKAQPVQPTPPPQPERIYVQTAITEASLPSRYKPLSPWAYFGYALLFEIPIVGFVFLIVFSFSKSNINRRNFARSYWCVLILCVIIVMILCIIALATGGFEQLMYRIQSMY